MPEVYIHACPNVIPMTMNVFVFRNISSKMFLSNHMSKYIICNCCRYSYRYRYLYCTLAQITRQCKIISDVNECDKQLINKTNIINKYIIYTNQ